MEFKKYLKQKKFKPPFIKGWKKKCGYLSVYWNWSAAFWWNGIFAAAASEALMNYSPNMKNFYCKIFY